MRSVRLFAWLVVAASSATVSAQPAAPVLSPELGRTVTFETGRWNGEPGGWGGGPPGTIFADDAVVHSGRWSARLERTPKEP